MTREIVLDGVKYREVGPDESRQEVEAAFGRLQRAGLFNKIHQDIVDLRGYIDDGLRDLRHEIEMIKNPPEGRSRK